MTNSTQKLITKLVTINVAAQQRGGLTAADCGTIRNAIRKAGGVAKVKADLPAQIHPLVDAIMAFRG